MSPSLAKNILRYGSLAPLPKTRILQAGQLVALLEEGDLRYLKFGDTEVIRRIYFAVRDHNWGTVLPTYSNWSVEANPGSFRVTFDAKYQRGEIDFFGRGEIRGQADSTITYTMDGFARSTFWRNRIGFCVLHSAALAGSSARIEHVDGTREQANFPTWVVSDQPVLPFSEMRAIAHEIAPGRWAEIRFEGEVFEMEDQRNWTDSSFKTFGTPVRHPFPVEVKQGTRISQTLTLSLAPAPGPDVQSRAPEQKTPLQITLGNQETALPDIGLQTASHNEPLSDRQLERIKQLRLNHLRVDVNLGKEGWREAFVRGTADATAVGVPLEVGLFLDDSPGAELSALKQALLEIQPPVKRWLIYPARERVWGGAPMREICTAARTELEPNDPRAQFASGTNSDFIILAHNLPPLDVVDAVCFQINPQLHAFDQSSLIETLEAQVYVVATARHLANNLQVIVSPVNFKMRFNPYLSAPEPAPPPGQLPSFVDPRQLSLFGAGWTAGSIKYLAKAGAASVTYYETTGWRGVMESEHGTRGYEKFPSVSGMLYPLYHVLADIGEMQGGSVLDVVSSDPLTIEAVAARHKGKTRLLVCNMTDEPQSNEITGLTASNVLVKRLNENTAEQAMLDGENFRRTPGASHTVVNQRLNLQLMPYETARIDFEIEG